MKRLWHTLIHQTLSGRTYFSGREALQQFFLAEQHIHPEEALFFLAAICLRTIVKMEKPDTAKITAKQITFAIIFFPHNQLKALSFLA